MAASDGTWSARTTSRDLHKNLFAQVIDTFGGYSPGGRYAGQILTLGRAVRSRSDVYARRALAQAAREDRLHGGITAVAEPAAMFTRLHRGSGVCVIYAAHDVREDLPSRSIRLWLFEPGP